MKPAHWLSVLVAGAGLNWGAFELSKWLVRSINEIQAEESGLEKIQDEISQSVLEFRSLREMKERDMDLFKSGFNSLAMTKKSLYESGLSLQEEKRLLEKLLEIMTTSIRADLDINQVSLMRGDHSMDDFDVIFNSTYPITEQQQKSSSLRITSKERFAHPERGNFEEKDGVLIWNPPQVGESTRSNALGEYVMFTNSNIVIHGPFKKIEEHTAFPHACLGLSLPQARKLYRNSFIGTRLNFIFSEEP